MLLYVTFLSIFIYLLDLRLHYNFEDLFFFKFSLMDSYPTALMHVVFELI